MGNNSTKNQSKNQSKFIGTVLEYANIQVELTRLYKQITGKDLVQSRLRTEQGVLDVLQRLEKQVFGEIQSGANIPDRVDRLSANAPDTG